VSIAARCSLSGPLLQKVSRVGFRPSEPVYELALAILLVLAFAYVSRGYARS
jgi:hypothetical protein